MQPGDIVVVSNRSEGKPAWAWDDEGKTHFLPNGTIGILLLVEEEIRVEPAFMICSVLIEDRILEMHIGDVTIPMNE